MRASMIDWMLKVITQYFKCSPATFFLAINIMDRYCAATSKSITTLDELHLIGIVSMFIASKYEDLYPLQLDLIVRKVGNYAFTADDIKLKEIEILDTLYFEITGPSSYDFMLNVMSSSCF